MITVFIADDHEIVREGLKKIIERAGDLRVAGEAGDGVEALRAVREGRFDVVVLDLAMPGLDGLEVLATLHAEQPRLAILMLSMYPERQFAVRALKAGALGYLTKQSVATDLIKAIRMAAQGRRYVSASLAEALAEAVGQPDAGEPHARLTDRELAVFLGLARGRSLKELAAELHLSEKTITTYRRRALDKTGLATNADVIRYAVDRKLVL